jgi:hypothetical protein
VIERHVITMTCERDGEAVPIEVMAYVCGGLCIHETIGAKGYTLTHLKSSMSIACGLRLPISLLCERLQDLAQIMDWSQDFDVIASIWVHDEEIKTAVLSGIRGLRTSPRAQGR